MRYSEMCRSIAERKLYEYKHCMSEKWSSIYKPLGWTRQKFDKVKSGKQKPNLDEIIFLKRKLGILTEDWEITNKKPADLRFCKMPGDKITRKNAYLMKIRDINKT